MSDKKQKDQEKGKRVNVEIAPAVLRALQEERAKRNADPNRATAKITYTDIINEALHSFLAS